MFPVLQIGRGPALLNHQLPEGDVDVVKALWFKPQKSASKSGPNLEPKVFQAPTPGEPINDTLKQHALAANDWIFQSASATLHEWAERFNAEFRLKLETPAISVQKIPARTYGTYRHGRNGLGVRHEITLNAGHLEQQPLAEQLATLLHELLHQWQEQYGKGGRHGYHNQQFRIMAKRFGLVVNDRGHHLGIEPGPFTQLLARHNVDMGTLLPPTEIPSFTKRPRGSSKLKLWICTRGCTRVRCAVELEAKCLKCGVAFVKEDDREF